MGVADFLFKHNDPSFIAIQSPLLMMIVKIHKHWVMKRKNYKIHLLHTRNWLWGNLCVIYVNQTFYYLGSACHYYLRFSYYSTPRLMNTCRNISVYIIQGLRDVPQAIKKHV